MMENVICLNKDWLFYSLDGKFRFNTDLPTSNYSVLLKNSIIPDPFVATNEKDVRWVAESDWIFEKHFDVPGTVLSYDDLSLNFKAIDTLADVYFNDIIIASTNNAHIKYALDVKKLIKPKDNIIKVVIKAPLKWVEERSKQHKLPSTGGGKGFNLVRKPAYHFGWDWGPVLPISGLTDSVFLEARNIAKIKDVLVATTCDNDVATLTITTTVEKFSEKSVNLEYSLYAPNGNPVKETLTNIGQATVERVINITDPELWYANGMLAKKAKQPLYKLVVKIFSGEELLDSKILKIGIRSLELSTKEVENGRDFAFIINNARIFAKGANWIPPDNLADRVTRASLERDISAMADAGFNMIRVWGGGYYASDDFYDLCDIYGILVWQDFMFACAPYPLYEKNYLNSVIEELRSNVPRIRHHASLALWCGNNEIEACCAGWSYNRMVIKNTGEVFYKILPDVLKTLDNITPYWAGSPSSGEYLKNVSSDDYGDTHIWNVWHGMCAFDYYLKRNSRFCSEFGFESMPSMDAIASFAQESDYDLNSKIMSSHQKCLAGNERMKYYMIQNYCVPKKFEHLVYLSQLTQADSIRWAVEHWRRNMGRCNGALYWQYNDCWPVSSWSSIDYTGKYKALQYMAKEFYKPIAASILTIKDTSGVYVTNDSTEDFSGELRVRVVKLSGESVSEVRLPLTLPAYTSKKMHSLNLDGLIKMGERNNIAIMAEILDNDGEVISFTSDLMVPERKAKIAKPSIKIDITETEDKINIALKSDKYVRRIMLDIKGCNTPLSKNFFDMEANRTYLVTLAKGELSASQVESLLTTTSVADIEPKYSRFAEKLMQLKIAFIPINFVNRFIYKYIM